MHNLILSSRAQNVFMHLEKLIDNPKFGKPLTSNLTGLWSYRAGNFRSGVTC